MSTSHFRVIEHTVQCPSLREYHNGVKSGQNLQLAIKQYVPLNNPHPAPDDITIIAGHANGIPKECYEPLWDDLLATSKVKIKAIWFADCANQGASGVLNEDKLGDDPNWFDHSRDLLSMVTHLQDQIQPPIVGVAHSFSCSSFVHLSLIHPRLFHTLIFLEPMIQTESPSKPGGRSPALWASTRPDLWPSQSEAEKHIRSNPFWRRWDSRAVAKYIEHGLRPVPTALYPFDPQSSNGEMSSAKVTPNSVTLTTTKAQEAWTYLRFNVTPYDGTTNKDMSSDSAERFLSPDLSTSAKEGTNNHPSYVATCPWTSLAFEFLPYIRPSVLFVWGEKSHINTPGARRDDKLLRVGTGLGGSGGVRAGMVWDEVVKGTSHTAPLEDVGETARVVSDWLVEQGKRYMEEKKFWEEYDSQKSERGGLALSEKWMEYIKLPIDTKRERKGSRL
ncbi:uncharacterized protein AKAW2_60442S [Aspergillus luchuensis]|uniref:Uncharacterized protein n=1 Tax=Aspergillus kawachii TaxID=1069201 RepID=A0A7R7WFS0_ASPKA|nr:uncharacterized protein AKAW2_60442S [Aspergillus luchuensis]BCS02178.1 hypothetical protein AKAW2_60442S [Aspergillus luchuensis]BCS13864.1 hypothetical protein ALUC_60420S [Aspergillus luchuensis]